MNAVNYEYIGDMIKKYRELIIDYGVLSPEACEYVTKNNTDRVFVENACKLFNYVMQGGKVVK